MTKEYPREKNSPDINIQEVVSVSCIFRDTVFSNVQQEEVNCWKGIKYNGWLFQKRLKFKDLLVSSADDTSIYNTTAEMSRANENRYQLRFLLFKG